MRFAGIAPLAPEFEPAMFSLKNNHAGLLIPGFQAALWRMP